MIVGSDLSFWIYLVLGFFAEIWRDFGRSDKIVLNMEHKNLWILSPDSSQTEISQPGRAAFFLLFFLENIRRDVHN